MLLGGDELGRTQRGNNNAYCQDNEISWYDWTSIDDGMTEFVRSLVSIRKAHAGFRLPSWPSEAESSRGQWELTWYGHSGDEIAPGAAPRGPREPLQALLSGEGRYHLIFNPSGEEVAFKPPPGRAEGTWRVLADTSAEAEPAGLTGAAGQVPLALVPYSMKALVLEE
jgi:glycogen operon protein